MFWIGFISGLIVALAIIAAAGRLFLSGISKGKGANILDKLQRLQNSAGK